MSQDEQLQELSEFQQSLIRFNEQLQSSLRELGDRYQSRASLWHEQWKREDEAILEPLSRGLSQYFERESPALVKLLNEEIASRKEEHHV